MRLNYWKSLYPFLVCSDAVAFGLLGGFDSMHFSIVLPLLYIFIAAGIHEVVTRWLAVFPRNPIARGVGIAIVAIAIGYTTYYHLTRTFIARPGNPQMRSFYAKINS
jgi:formate-dependent nitrite reductase membrane component NrfD